MCCFSVAGHGRDERLRSGLYQGMASAVPRGLRFHLGFSRWGLLVDAGVNTMHSSSRQNSCRLPFGNRTPIIGSCGYD